MNQKAGELRHRIQIQNPNRVQDANTGEFVTGWVNVATDVPAKIRPLTVREFLAAQKENSEISAVIVIRYRAGITAQMRIIHIDKIYNIVGALPDQDSGLEYLTIPVKQGVNEGGL